MLGKIELSAINICIKDRLENVEMSPSNRDRILCVSRQKRLKLRTFIVFQERVNVELNELIGFELVLEKSRGHQLLCKGKQYIPI